MLSFIIVVVVLTIVQMLIASLWYSKFLFGNLFVSLSNFKESDFDQNSVKSSYLKAIFVAVLKSAIIFAITHYIFIILPQTFFITVVLIILLTVLQSIDEVLWGKKNFVLYVINSAEAIFSYIVCFTIALLVINN